MSTLPDPPDETPDLPHVYALVCDQGDELADVVRDVGAFKAFFRLLNSQGARCPGPMPPRAPVRRCRLRERGLR